MYGGFKTDKELVISHASFLGKTARLSSLLKTFIYEKNDRKKHLLIVIVVSVCFMITNLGPSLTLKVSGNAPVSP